MNQNPLALVAAAALGGGLLYMASNAPGGTVAKKPTASIVVKSDNGSGQTLRLEASGEVAGVVETAKTAILILDRRPAPTPNPDPPAPQPVPPNPPPPNPAPTPPVPPTPNPVPPGPEPAGLAGEVVAWARGVLTPTKLQEALKLADATKALREQIAAQTLSGSVRIALAAKAALNAAVGPSNLAAWQPVQAGLLAHLTKLRADGHLKSNADWLIVLGELESGLRLVAAGK